MKTFEEWLIKNHQEELEEGRLAQTLGTLGLAAASFLPTGGKHFTQAAGIDPQATASVSQANTQNYGQQLFSSKDFDVIHAIQVLRLSPTVAKNPDKVYDRMIKLWQTKKLTPSQWSAFYDHYKENEVNPKTGIAPCYPPAFKL